ncbi:MAG: hypothetical protein P4L53_16255 [Candidatus Obscuribacterales bacterium]|nr:hypothetical protein [Candidatus Obscuribacterales bacterium]
MERSQLQAVKDTATDFGKGFVQTAVENPWNGVAQLLNEIPGVKVKELHSATPSGKVSFAEELGAKAGSIGELIAVTLATKYGAKSVFKLGAAAEKRAVVQTSTFGLAGAINGGMFTPSEDHDHLLTSRIKQGAIQGGTFASMSIASAALGGGFDGALVKRMSVNAAGGAVGGATHALLTEGLMHHRLASADQVASDAATYAAFGAAFTGIHFAVGKALRVPEAGPVKEEYPSQIKEMLTPFKRLSNEPILGPREGKFDSAGAFNPTATRLPDGDVAILYRAQDAKGVSTVGLARTAPDGVTVLERSDEPVLAPRVDNERLGIEDPRMTADPVNPAQWDLTATKWDGHNAQLSDWTSTDLREWHERGIMMPANEGTWNTQWTKSGSIVSREVDGKFVPEKIDGKFWMFYMGSRAGVDEMGLASSVDGRNWSDATNEPILPARPGQFDSNVVEPGPTAILTDNGINLIYSGGMPYEGGKGMFKYQAGVAVFDKNDPTNLLYRSDKPIFSPETSWEKENSSTTVHQVPNVVFPQGIVPDGHGGYIVYYGAADSYVGAATTRFAPVNRFDWLNGLTDSGQQSVLRSPALANPEIQDDKKKTAN